MIYLGAPRLKFSCRSTWEELEREYKPLRTTHVTGYGRCEQLFTLFFAYASSVTHASVTAFCYITSVDRFHDTREADRGTTHESRGLDRSLERSRQKGAPRAA